MSETTSNSLTEAWLAKAHAAEVDLNYAAAAPALFKPEFVQQRQDDYAAALRWARFWHSQAMTS